MKKVVIVIISLLILITLLLYCERDDYKTEIFNDTFKIIYGEWKHIESHVRHVIHFSQDTLFFDKLIIKPIGKFYIYTNEGLFYNGKIIIKNQTDTKLIVEFNPPGPFFQEEFFIRFQSNDTMLLDPNCLDCLTYYAFARIK